MHPHLSRTGRLLAGLAIVLLIIVASSWFVVQPSQSLAPQPTPSGPAIEAPPASQSPADPVTAPAAPESKPRKSAEPGQRLYVARGKVEGTPLPKRAPDVRDGTEKGIVMEIEKFSPETLGALAEGESIVLPVPGGEVVGVVNLVQHDEGGWVRIGGDLPEDAGSFTLASSVKDSGGVIMLPTQSRAYEVVTEPTGRVLMVERRLSDVRCFVLLPKNATTSGTGSGAVNAAPPVLSSRPNAPAVVYLDFDGATVSDPAWNSGRTIVAPASGLSVADMTAVFNRVKEDFAPFNVDITTNANRYNAVAANRRTRCIITSNDAAAPGSGGVAYINSFSKAGTTFSSTIPCWVFNEEVIGIAEAASHEVGHTMGLDHDGRTIPSEEYYDGHGTGVTGWAPIMGGSYDRQLTQWSKGEYYAASNKQDDLLLISRTANGFGYVADDAVGTTTAGATLTVSGNSINQPGLIDYNDIDVFRFTAQNGPLSVTANPAMVSPNLDIKLELLNSGGAVMISANPTAGLSANISSTLTAGTYYLRVSGIGKGDVLVDGYSKYGSIGAYSLTGTVSATTTPQPPVITSAGQASGQVGIAFTYRITATNSPTFYSVTGALPSGLSITSSSGLISGTPTVAGSASVTLNATNGQGTGSLGLTITVAARAITLAEAIDLTGTAVTSTGNALWVPQSSVTFDSVDAAISGNIGNSQTSSIQIDVTGPVTLEFRWKVDSEANYDKLSYVLDGVVKESISGTTAWALRSVSIPSGAHRIQWTYKKDSSISTGADAGWLDTVTLRNPASSAIRLVGDLAFGNVVLYSSVSRNMTIFNDGTASLDVSSISYPGGFSGAFAGSIAAGASRVVAVTFSPTALQPYSGSLSVNSNAVSGVNNLVVSGSGVATGTPVLQNNVGVTGLSGATYSQRTYRIPVPAGTTRLTVTTTGGTGDVDIYLKRGSAPTLSAYDLKSDGYSNSETITALNPVAGDWYVMIDAYDAYSEVTLKAVW